jgi:sugar/nucleoside kinase (ribokinase family)
MANNVLVLGTVAVDSVRTPFGVQKKSLGGSATYASYSASFFSPVRLVAAIGYDFPAPFKKIFHERPIDLDGLEVDKKHRSFHWKGRYGYDLNEAITLSTHLNVLEHFNPNIPKHYSDTPFVFLANIDPVLQIKVLNKMNPRWVVLDSMNFWIQNKPKLLIRAAKRADLIVLNDAEARQLSQESSLIIAAKKLHKLGLKRIVIKKGEHGALLFQNGKFFSAPGYPQEATIDPTGCGDTFAGGLIGYLARCRKINQDTLKRSVIMGSVMASFTIEDFSLNRLRRLKPKEINRRHQEFKHLVRF